MKREEIREQGLVGTFFWDQHPKASVLILGGFSGELQEERAKALAKKGFSVLALSYFGVDPLPKQLSEIPLEYFEKAIEILKSRFSKVGLWGISRGAELSLILGTLFSEKIGAIAAHVPSSVVYGSLDGRNVPAWTFQGKAVAPNAPFSYPLDETLGKKKTNAICSTPFFLKAMTDKKAFELSAIEVERLKCPLLLISAKDDQMWPSSLFASQIKERLKRYNSPIYCAHLDYPGVGHSPSRGSIGMHPVINRWFVYGGTEEQNQKAAKDWIRQTLSFFEDVL